MSLLIQDLGPMICCWPHTICSFKWSVMLFWLLFLNIPNILRTAFWRCQSHAITHPLNLRCSMTVNHFSHFFSRISLTEFNLVMLIHVLKLFPCSFYRACMKLIGAFKGSVPWEWGDCNWHEHLWMWLVKVQLQWALGHSWLLGIHSAPVWAYFSKHIKCMIATVY